MLETISIKNIALIDELSLDFGADFNVLSGETGAGKSILIGALSFLLGGKLPPTLSERELAKRRFPARSIWQKHTPKLPHGCKLAVLNLRTTAFYYGVP